MIIGIYHRPMRIIYTLKIIEDWMGPNPNAHISNFTFLGKNPKSLGFIIIWADLS
jgi:hypothetical protein